MEIFKAAVICIFLFSQHAMADEKADDWIAVVSSTDGDSWEIKSHSLILTETKSGVPMALVTGRVVRTNNTVSLYRWYVTDADCLAEYGKLVMLEISGNYLGESDYLKGAGTLASYTAEYICEGAKYMQSQKGI
jgi:hypothetical protein